MRVKLEQLSVAKKETQFIYVLCLLWPVEMTKLYADFSSTTINIDITFIFGSYYYAHQVLQYQCLIVQYANILSVNTCYRILSCLAFIQWQVEWVQISSWHIIVVYFIHMLCIPLSSIFRNAKINNIYNKISKNRFIFIYLLYYI